MCRGMCVCIEMWRMCVLYVSFGSKVRPRTSGCIAMGSAVLFNYHVGGVCGMCMCMARGGVGGVVSERIGFVVYQSG